MPTPVPLLLLSDSPTAGSGLARITRDLAVRIATKLPDVFRVATFGYGGLCSRALPFHQYVMEGRQGWITPTLPEVWADFAGSEQGIVLTIWDIARLTWFSQPVRSNALGELRFLQKWLTKAPFKRWGYFPIDASGPLDRLSFPLRETLLGFDRILSYGPWAHALIQRSFSNGALEKLDLGWLPHGIDTSVFYAGDHNLSRSFFLSNTGAQRFTDLIASRLTDPVPVTDEVLIGIIATNQSRKDYVLGIETAAILARTHRILLWIHTDELERFWSIPTLLVDYGLGDSTVLSTGFISDEKMAQAYSACDLTFGIGAEGWGYPLAESLACGTPVIHGDYAGGAHIVPRSMRVHPFYFHKEGMYASTRPIYRPGDWARCARTWLNRRATLDPEFDWDNLWPRWEAWLRAGVSEKAA